MCGIFGYVGKKNTAAEIVLEGLKLLEYRGYDSWGVTVKSGKKLVVDKHVGKIGDAKVKLPKSTIGIGHTRWATHGGVTVANAHPHLDCTKTVAVIHNGIIENFEELKTDLIKKGHKFLSETDTEVVPHLIEQYLKKAGFASAVRDAFNQLKGLNAIVVAYAPSQEIVAAKTGSPLVVGIGKNEFFVASDAAGILKHTRNMLFLGDNEMVILGPSADGLQLLSLPSGKKKKPVFETIDWKIEDVDKGKFDYFMLKEIYEQPKVIRNIAQTYTDQITSLAKAIEQANGTFFIGAGTAFHACLAGTYLFSTIAHTHVNTAVASEFNYLEDFLTNKSLIIALSQSGETIDVIEPLHRAKQKGSKVVAVTNVLGSSIYRLSDHKLLLGAGPEKAVASTKAYIAKLSVMILLAYSLANKFDHGKKLLLAAADEVGRLLQEANLKGIKKLALQLRSVEHIYTIGRGLSFATALESSLKIKEVSYIHTEGLAGGELKHGTIAL
ncbi:glutamine--fructose-6-phosphate transaminase (isomerizing), partial [Candidatus Microgenomates bacterium]|nr:glutamine--fructose-6-phosphate transaminase (isomerizing) [Candidatus Microgenomates bacterium]